MQPDIKQLFEQANKLGQSASQKTGVAFNPITPTITPTIQNKQTGTITPDAINTPSLNVPQPKNRTQDFASTLGMDINALTGVNKTAVDNASQFAPAETVSPLQQSQQDLLTKVFQGFEKLTGKKAFIQKENEDLQTAKMQQEVTNYDNQLKAEQRALDIETRRLQAGEGVGAGLMGNQNVRIQQAQRQSLQKQADIAILKSAAQSDYVTAQNIISQKVELQFGEVQDQVDLAKEYLTLIQPSLNAEEKKKAQAQALFLDERQRLLDEDKEKSSQAMNIGLEVAKNGNSALAQQIFALANSGDYDGAIAKGISSGGMYKAPAPKDTSANEEKSITSFYEDASKAISDLESKKITWATAYDVLKAKYPQASSQLIDETLNKTKRYGYSVVNE